MLRISVITSVYNGAATIGEALASVHGQSWPAVEHVVVDAGSTDGTRDILARQSAGIARLICEPDHGIYDGLNKGVRHATGDVVGFLHADDAYAGPHVLERIASAFEDPSIEAVYGDLVYVARNDSSRIVRYWRAGSYRPERLRTGWMPPHPTFFARRSVYERLGGFDTRLRIAADYDCMLRFLWGGRVNAAYLPEILVRMRLGGASNSSLLNLARKSFEDCVALRQNGLAAHALLWKNVMKLPQFIHRPSGPLGRTAGGSLPRG